MVAKQAVACLVVGLVMSTLGCAPRNPSPQVTPFPVRTTEPDAAQQLEWERLRLTHGMILSVEGTP